MSDHESLMLGHLNGRCTTACPYCHIAIIETENAKLWEVIRAQHEALDKLANGYAGNGWDIGLVPRINRAREVLAKTSELGGGE